MAEGPGVLNDFVVAEVKENGVGAARDDAGFGKKLEPPGVGSTFAGFGANKFGDGAGDEFREGVA